MTDDTVTSVDMDSDLDAFEAEFYSTANIVKQEAEPEPKVEEEVDDPGEEDENDPPAPEEEDESDSDVEDEEPEEDPQPKRKNKTSLQERINDALAKERIANERAESLRRELETLKAAVEKINPQKDEATAVVRNGAPDPDALGEDGLPLYPLGEFDKLYVRDLTKYMVEEQMQEKLQEQAQMQEQQRFEAAQAELAQSWAAKVESYEKEVPEFRENLRQLSQTFQDIEGPYGEYLATTIMASEYGPEMMDYLSQNIGEAQKIVNSGAAAATLALGRLEARFERMADKDGDQKSNKKPTKAPEPPEQRTRGSGGRFAVDPATDNLDAFEKEFFS